MNYLIIGSGFAAIGAIEGIREYDQKGSITLISKEQNYSRPLISYYLGKKVSEDALPYRNKDFFEKNNVKLKLGTSAQSIDTTKKEITYYPNPTKTMPIYGLRI